MNLRGQETASRQKYKDIQEQYMIWSLKCIVSNKLKDDCKGKSSGHVWTCFDLLVQKKFCSR